MWKSLHTKMDAYLLLLLLLLFLIMWADGGHTHTHIAEVPHKHTHTSARSIAAQRGETPSAHTFAVCCVCTMCRYMCHQPPQSPECTVGVCYSCKHRVCRARLNKWKCDFRFFVFFIIEYNADVLHVALSVAIITGASKRRNWGAHWKHSASASANSYYKSHSAIVCNTRLSKHTHVTHTHTNHHEHSRPAHTIIPIYYYYYFDYCHDCQTSSNILAALSHTNTHTETRGWARAHSNAMRERYTRNWLWVLGSKSSRRFRMSSFIYRHNKQHKNFLLLYVLDLVWLLLAVLIRF